MDSLLFLTYSLRTFNNCLSSFNIHLLIHVHKCLPVLLWPGTDGGNKVGFKYLGLNSI